MARKTSLPKLVTLSVAIAAVIVVVAVWSSPVEDKSPGATLQISNELPAVAPAVELAGLGVLPQSVTDLQREAELACERLEKDSDGLPEAYAVRALYFIQTDRQADSARAWEQALQKNGKFLPALLGVGLSALDEQKYERAEPLLLAAMEAQGDNEEAFAGLIRLYLDQSKFDHAEAIGARFVAKYPELAKSHFRFAEALIENKKWPDARRELEAAIRIDAKFSPAYFSLATVCARLGDQAVAKAHREEFARLKTALLEEERKADRSYDDSQSIRQVVADIYRSSGDVYLLKLEARAKAEACWLRGLDVLPNHVGCREALLHLYEQQTRFNAAITVLERLCRNDADNPEFWSMLADWQQKRGDFAAAREALKTALKLSPDEPTMLLQRAKLLLADTTVKPDEALAAARTAAEKGPTAESLLILAAAYQAKGMRTEALAAVNEALQLAPNDPQLLEARSQIAGSR